jgi:hypothetical protein
LGTINAARTVGFDSAYIASPQALQGFRMLPTSTPTAFIYTGNTLNQIAIPGVMPFALGKVAAAMLVEYAANAYGKDGYKFDLFFCTSQSSGVFIVSDSCTQVLLRR